MNIPTLTEGRRGCGYRSAGGLYLVSDGSGEDCAKLPVPLEVCPTCGQGIKPTRGWTWIAPDVMVQPEPHGSKAHAAACPLSTGVERCGLLWIGGSFYPTTASFVEEAEKMGVSRRIPAVPRDFKLGEWVFLAHREADWKPCPDCGDSQFPGFQSPAPDAKAEDPLDECPTCKGRGLLPVRAVFFVFQPTRIEYVVRGDESEEELERLVERDVTPVRVERLEDQDELEEAA